MAVGCCVYASTGRLPARCSGLVVSLKNPSLEEGKVTTVTSLPYSGTYVILRDDLSNLIEENLSLESVVTTVTPLPCDGTCVVLKDDLPALKTEILRLYSRRRWTCVYAAAAGPVEGD